MSQQIESTKREYRGWYGCFILIVDKYNGETPWEDVKKIFKTHNIQVFNTTILSEELF
jgi:hypothetical protein